MTVIFFRGFILAAINSTLIISVLLPHRRWCFVNLNEAARSSTVRLMVSEIRVRLHGMCCQWQTYSHFPSPPFLPLRIAATFHRHPSRQTPIPLSHRYHLQMPRGVSVYNLVPTSRSGTLREFLDSSSIGPVSQIISQPLSTCFQC